MKQTPELALRFQESKLERGLRLARVAYHPWLAGLTDSSERAMCAILMDNLRNDYFIRFGRDLLAEGLNELQETTTTAQVATFTRHAFPLVRAAMPALAATSLVSVQPMDGPTGLVFFMDAIYGTTKGNVVKGTKMFPNPNQYYSDETVWQEPVATGDASETVFGGTASFTPIKPNTVTITAASDTITDNGSGTLTGDGSGTINYVTGAYDITFSSAPGSSVAITITYDYNMEGNPRIPQVDLSLTSVTVTARERKLKMNFNAETTFDLLSQHGLSADAELTAWIGTELKYEIDAEILGLLNATALDNSAGALVADFDRTEPSGVAFVDHKEKFYDTLLEIDGHLLKTNGRARAAWVVCDTEIGAIIRSIARFDDTGITPPRDARGVTFIGTVGKFDVYEDTARVAKTFLVGCKPTNPLDQGFIYAPYIPLFGTPQVMLDDFISRQGFMTKYATQTIHSDFYIKNRIVKT